MTRELLILTYGILVIRFADLVWAESAGQAGEIVPAQVRWAAGGPGGVPGFTRHVQPLLGKMGCNGRACHGSFQGQAGFRLSLFGSDPAMDYAALKERVDIDQPDDSLALLKPTRQVEHEGGRRFDVSSWQHRLLRAWIAAGAPYTPDREAHVERLEIIPAEVQFTRRGDSARCKVVARFSDKTVEDVTALTQFSSNDDVIAGVTNAGVITARDSGDTAVVVTFGGVVSTAQVFVPYPGPQDRSFTFDGNNKIDELVAAKWIKLGLKPSGLSTDSEFLRRVSLDLIGTLPTADEVRKFVADTDPMKRARKIDELLQRREYAMYWATKFSDWTGNDSAATPPPQVKTAWLWHAWFRDKLEKNVPYDEIAAGIVTATTREGRTAEEAAQEFRTVAREIGAGLDAKNARRPPADATEHFDSAAYAKRRTNDLFWKTYSGDQAALRISYAFLGIRLECAKCHKHPEDRWTQTDYAGYTAFFNLIATGVPDDVPDDVVFPQGGDQRHRELVYRYSEVFVGKQSEARNKGGKGIASQTKGSPITARLPAGAEHPLKDGEDARVILMDWMRARDNPYFAKALVNRLWAHYVGIGLIEPADEISAANPPTNPELLDWLAKDFIDHQFDLQHLHRTILNSRVYQLSWRPNTAGGTDERNYARALLRRLPAEVIVDALNQATGSEEDAYLWKAKTYTAMISPAGTRAINLAPTRFGGNSESNGYALEVFGRPLRAETCDAERSSDVALPQVLYLMNDAELQGKITAPDGRLARLLQTINDDRALVEELYLGTLSRYPNKKEMQAAIDYTTRAADRKAAFEDLLWSLLNVREFVLNH